MSRLARRLGDSRGSVAVEFALFLPFLMMLVFGVVELGSAWFQRQMLVNASREGARLGSLLDDASNSAAQIQATVSNYLQTAGFPGAVTVTSSGADGGAGAQVQVTVSSPYQLPVLGSLVPGALSSVTLQGVTVMRHE